MVHRVFAFFDGYLASVEILQERILDVFIYPLYELTSTKAKISHAKAARKHPRNLGVEETHEMAFNTDHLAGIPLLLTNAKARHINLVVYCHCMYPIQSRCIQIFVG